MDDSAEELSIIRLDRSDEMNTELNEMRTTIQDALWFSCLGGFSSRDGFVAITDYDTWANFTGQGVAEEFGLRSPLTIDPQQEKTLLAMTWLPTSQTDEDPFHGSDVVNRIKVEGKAELLKESRLELCKLARSGLRNTKPSHWMRIGSTDYTEAAIKGALFTIRMATAEVVGNTNGIWCSLCNLFAAGHWPLGRLPSGEIVVL